MVTLSSTKEARIYNGKKITSLTNYSVLCIRWPKYWTFNFSISSSNGYSGLISFWVNWFDLLAIQKTLNGLHQHHSSKASILQHSAFFMVQLSHPYMTTGKTIALTKRTFVGKVMSLLFNMLSRLVIASLPRSFSSKSKCLLISWLQSPSAVILEPKKIKSVTMQSASMQIVGHFLCLTGYIFSHLTKLGFTNALGNVQLVLTD